MQMSMYMPSRPMASLRSLACRGAMSKKQAPGAQDVHDIMGAGHETTASTAAAALWAIAAHPRAEAGVHAELDRVLGAQQPWLCSTDPWLHART